MKEKIKKYWWVIIIILIVGGVFYWFQWRPSQIIKLCNEKAIEEAKTEDYLNEAVKVYDAIYKTCLRGKGL